MESKKLYIKLDNYSVINIGPSDKSIIRVIIKTKLHLSDKFLTDPFGTTRTRFQYPEIFEYKILNTTKNKEFNIYELQITRNNINCASTSKFFWKNGWKLNLNITNFTKLTATKLTKNKILEILPKNYGKVDLKLDYTSIKFKIGIVVPFYSRCEYVTKFLDSLAKTDIKDCLFIFMDESLTKEKTDDNTKVNTLVRNFTCENLNIIKIYKNKHGNMFDSILRGLDVLSFFCDNLMTIDSDTIHKKNWINKCLNLQKKLSNNSNRPVIISGFNTINTGKHTLKKEFETYYLKNTVGGCQICFSSETYLKYIRCTLISYKWDTNLVNNIISNNGIIAVTKPSVIDHIGFKSSGHRKDSSNIYDYALDF